MDVSQSLSCSTDHSQSLMVSQSQHISIERDNKTKRLVEWNVEILCGLLRRIVARREAKVTAPCSNPRPTRRMTDSVILRPIKRAEMVLDEVAEIINLPSYNECAVARRVDPDSIQLDPDVVWQLRQLVTNIASMYR